MSFPGMTAGARNAYQARVVGSAGGWRVVIEDPAGRVVFERACGDASEARTFASTVRQHIYWLSPERFREYYRV